MSQLCFSQSSFVVLVLLLLGFILTVFYHMTFQHNLPSLVSGLPVSILTPASVLASTPSKVPVDKPVVVTVPMVPVPIAITVVPDTSSLPERKYIQMDDTRYHNIGFLYNKTDSTMRLFSRRKYPRGERYEFYVIDKNGIQIPFTTKNDMEIFDGDSVIVPEFADLFTATVYPVQTFIYNPNVS